eukprot:1097447-Rhodomonas_salina.1
MTDTNLQPITPMMITGELRRLDLTSRPLGHRTVLTMPIRPGVPGVVTTGNYKVGGAKSSLLPELAGLLEAARAADPAARLTMYTDSMSAAYIVLRWTH